MKLPLLLHTLRHLRWEQIVYRPVRIAQYRLYRQFPRLAQSRLHSQGDAPRVDPETIAKFRAIFETSFSHLNRPFDKSMDDVASRRFTFLNRTLTLDSIDWNRRYENHLWNYHLHYFNYVLPCARGDDQAAMGECRRLIESWIETARIGQSDGWAPYPISIRTVNWIYAYALIAGRCKDRQFLDRWRTSIFEQLNFLAGHLEFHLLANHLLKNIKAIVIGGLFFGRADWLEKGERLLRREFEEQVLDDGGHYERAPMYHAQTLQDFLECYALLREFGRIKDPEAPEAIESKLRAMAAFLEAMTCPDGTLALFNDSANTQETRPGPTIESAKQICAYTERSYPFEFPQTGYFLWESADRSEKIVVDAGPPAVDYNAAHAHCDMLSYEMWIDGMPFIVDSGLHGYEGDRFREYSRSTRAHNTVTFDGIEQSEIWGTFRMARRAEIIEAKSSGDEKRWSFKGAYRRYDGLVHERLIDRTSDGSWVIGDRTDDSSARHARSFIHLHPRIERAEIEAGGYAVICRAGRPGEMTIRIEPTEEAIGATISHGDETPIQGWRFHDFGIAEKSRTIRFDFRAVPGKVFGYKISKL